MAVLALNHREAKVAGATQVRAEIIHTHTQQLAISNEHSGDDSEYVTESVRACACVEACTEREFRLQTPHCDASNGRSHFSTYQFLQSAVPGGKRGIMGRVFN